MIRNGIIVKFFFHKTFRIHQYSLHGITLAHSDSDYQKAKLYAIKVCEKLDISKWETN